MELREALEQIGEIRRQMARGEVFRGYRSATAAFTGVVAVVCGMFQSAWFGRGAEDFPGIVLLWVIAAGACLSLVGVEMAWRNWKSDSRLQRGLTMLAIEQFMPSVMGGGLMTWVFWDFLRGELGMLPGVWMVLFAMGVFASSRLMPRAVFGVAGFYLLMGMVALALFGRGVMFSPWLMGGVFGIGQWWMAGILYFRLERGHE